MRSIQVILRLLLRLYLLCVGACALARLGLLAWQWERLADLTHAQRALALLHGLRIDSIAAGFALLPVALVLTLWPTPWRRVAERALAFWMPLAVLLFVFMELATFPFFQQYDVRPNHLFLEYLRYPREVGEMLWKDQKLSLGLTVLILAALLVGLRRSRAFGDLEPTLARPWLGRALWCLPLLVVLALMIRSSLGHRPANLSDALYSPNRVANEIAKNSLYSVARAAMLNQRGGGRIARTYGTMPMDEAYARSHALLGLKATPGAQPFVRELKPAAPVNPPRNLVLIVQESMGAQFVGHLGDTRALTPRLDALAATSLAFTQAYSNGTRSIRGLSAMSAGFQAVPGEGVLKRPKSQSGFFSLASLLKPLGYHASFIYGGEARFDEMKTWYLGNGFDQVIEQKDYVKPGFVSTWGVSDEDLLMKAHQRFTELSQAGKPFVSVVFTSSNHVPFELPEGKIEWVPGVPRASVENAIRYADYAVGRFFDEARRAPYFERTVFVVVADHNVRVYGDDVVPVPAFRIPAVIHAPGLAPRRFDGLASQPDVLATALQQLGVPLMVPILGNPIDLPGRQPFTLMQFNENYGFRRGDQVAVFRPDKPARTYRYDGTHLAEAPEDAELQRDGLALLHTLEDLVERRLYTPVARPAAATASPQ